MNPSSKHCHAIITAVFMAAWANHNPNDVNITDFCKDMDGALDKCSEMASKVMNKSAMVPTLSAYAKEKK